MGASNLTRRDWLTLSALAFGTACLPATADEVPLVQLSLNENPFGPSPLAVQAIKSVLVEVDRYAGDDALALEKQIAHKEGVSPDQIILGEILDALGLQLALAGSAGGEFLYSEPGYTALIDAVSPGGGLAVPVPLDASLKNDLPAIASKVGPQTRAIYLVNPHNPTGTVNDADEFKIFLRDMAKRTIVVVDEAYLEFEPNFDERTAASLVREGANVIVFRTFAKIYGLAGLAMGYAVAPTAIAASLKTKGLGEPHGLNRLALAAASESLRDTTYIAATRAKVVSEREKWNVLLDSLNVRRSDSRGNFVFFETRRPHADFAGAMRAHGVDIGKPFPPLDSWARVSIGLPSENLPARDAVRQLLR